MIELGAKVNLVICQKSKIADWVEHFNSNYDGITVLDLTKKDQLYAFSVGDMAVNSVVGVINYELAFRRPELAQLKTLLLC